MKKRYIRKTIFKDLEFFVDNEIVCAGVESFAICWLHIGFNHIGIHMKFDQKQHWWKSILPLFRLGILTTNSVYSKRWLICIHLFRFYIGIPLINNKIQWPRVGRGLYNI
jgi:hypothetical protein